MSEWLERAKLIQHALGHNPEDAEWDAFVEVASMCDSDDIASLLDEIFREKTRADTAELFIPACKLNEYFAALKQEEKL